MLWARGGRRQQHQCTCEDALVGAGGDVLGGRRPGKTAVRAGRRPKNAVSKKD